MNTSLWWKRRQMEKAFKQVAFSREDLNLLEQIRTETGLKGGDLRDEFLHRKEEEAAEKAKPYTAGCPYDPDIKGLYFSGRLGRSAFR